MTRAARVRRAVIVTALAVVAVGGAPAPARADPSAEFGDAVARRVADLMRQPNAQSGPFTWTQLQQMTQGVAGGYTLDPSTGGAWDIPTLLQKASGQPTWLDDSASTEARELQMRQVYALLTWQWAGQQPSQVEIAAARTTTTTADGFQSCAPNQAGGWTLLSDLANLWTTQLAQAQSNSFFLEGYQAPAVGVIGNWSSSTREATVEIARRLEKIPLGDTSGSSGMKPLPNHYLNGSAVFASHGYYAAVPQDYQSPANGRTPLKASIKPTTAATPLFGVDAVYESGHPLGEGADIEIAPGGPFRTKWTIPLDALIQPGTNADPQLREAVIMVYGANESPAGWPPSNLHSNCSANFRQSTGGSTITYSMELPPLTGNTSATILGTLVDGAERPIKGHTVQLSGPNGIYQEAITDDLGAYAFNALTPGLYRVEPARPAGLQAVTATNCDNGAGQELDLGCEVTVHPTSNRIQAHFKLEFTDLVAEGLEVTQGIQVEQWMAPGVVSAPGHGGLPGGTYIGVPLAASVPTVARFYAHVDPKRSQSLEIVPARLRAYRDGVELAGSPLDADDDAGQPGGRKSIGVGPALAPNFAGARSDPAGAVSFRLPVAWTTPGTVTLVAEIDAPSGLREHEEANNATALANVTFRAVRPIEIHQVKLEYTFGGRTQSPADLAPAFRRTAEVMPIRADALTVSTFADAPVADITAGIAPLVKRYRLARPDLADCVGNGECLDKVRALSITAVEDIRRGSASRRDFTFGSSPVAQGSLSNGHAEAVVAAHGATTRMLTGTAHELGHLLGRAHAGQNCPQTGRGAEQEGEPWPPDDQGLIGGLALDRRPGSAALGPYRIFGVSPPTFDFMSYCPGGNDSLVWVSVRNWTRYVDEAATARAAPPRARAAGVGRAAAGPRRLAVDAVALPSGRVDILGVHHETGAATPAARSATYTVVVRDAAGRAVARRGVVAEPIVDGDGGAIISAVLPTSRGRSLQILRGGKVVAGRRAARRAPKVRLRAPRRGARIPRSGSVRVRWTIRRARRGCCTTRVEISADNGRSWRAAASGLVRTRTTIPAALFGGAKRPRIRIVVNDGFNDVTARSGRLRRR